jgi:hypothetical protein
MKFPIYRYLKALLMPKRCQHIHKHLYVEETVATCEKTVLTCLTCGKVLASITEC